MTTFRTLAAVRHHGMLLTDYEFQVPLDHERPSGESLAVFARAVMDSEKATENRPWLVFLQGGPGFPGPRPSTNSGWLKRALDDYHVLLLDSRGNGRSSVVLPRTLALRGNARAQADYLMHFRADSIVRDAESIRRRLLGDGTTWSILGQSYGGFCAVHYLSAHPGGLSEVFITGGLPPLDASVDDYYRHTYPEVQRKTRKFFARYPADRELCSRILDHLHRTEVLMPTGARLTPRRFQQVGFMLGFDEGMENLHYLLEDAFCTGAGGDELSPVFLRELEHSQPFDTHPIFAVLHEMCYTQGGAARWSAERVRGEYPDMDWQPGKAPSFTGEMIYPWMFEDYPGLCPLREVAELLAAEERWPRLYDPAQLALNTVPCVAAVYAEDMYVPRALSERTATAIAGMKIWLTNEYEHSGLRTSNGAVLDRLFALRRDLL
jgi:pimeloyl-ACP methyl ester carboxylesterase